MNLLAGLGVLQVVASDSSTDSGSRTLAGALGMLVIIALVIGIGMMMTGSAKS